jgi:hypothetical protein
MATVNISAMAKTWNDAGTTFTAIGLDVTDTASNAASLLMDLQVGGTSQFTVAKDGGVRAKNGSHLIPGYSFQNNTDDGFGLLAGSQIYAILGGTPQLGVIGGGQVRLVDLGFSVTNAGNGARVILTSDDANILALRNGASAQTKRVYGTYTDASNYERLAITRDAITVESAGTGTANIDLALTPAGTGVLKFGTHAAIGAETVTGYITIKDSGGTSRKVAVVS